MTTDPAKPTPRGPSPPGRDIFADQDEYGIDLSLIRDNLRLTPAQRLERADDALRTFVWMKNARRIK